MLQALKTMFIMSILGGISSGIGGILGGVFKIKDNKILAMLYEITAGMMTGIVCFDMLPESFAIINVWWGLFGFIMGVGAIYLLETIISYMKYHKKKKIQKGHTYSTMSLVIMLSMAIHNMIEGLAIGSGMVYSISLGTSILLSILLHDIPEGMVVGVANQTEKTSFLSLVSNCVFVGMSVGIGSFIGELVGGISEKYVSLCLSLAAGAMLYIVACDLIPSSKKLSQRRVVSLIYIVGIILGIVITKI